MAPCACHFFCLCSQSVNVGVGGDDYDEKDDKYDGADMNEADAGLSYFVVVANDDDDGEDEEAEEGEEEDDDGGQGGQ